MLWARKDPGLVFTSSWTDFFLSEVDPDWREEAWDIIRTTPQNTYQILTKRPENIADMLPDDWGNGWPQVWLGISAENQETADQRIPLLLTIPAKIHFLSLEPLLGPIDLSRVAMPHGFIEIHGGQLPGVDWVIVGGESGLAAHARPMHPVWAEDLLNQCQAANIPFFFKQWGQWAPSYLDMKKYPVRKPDGKTRMLSVDGHFSDVNWDPDDIEENQYMMAPMGKKKAGNYLAGSYWQQFPLVPVSYPKDHQCMGLYNDNS